MYVAVSISVMLCLGLFAGSVQAQTESDGLEYDGVTQYVDGTMIAPEDLPRVRYKIFVGLTQDTATMEERMVTDKTFVPLEDIGVMDGDCISAKAYLDGAPKTMSEFADPICWDEPKPLAKPGLAIEWRVVEP